MANYSLVKHTDMMAEVRDEAVDICMNAVEKFPSDLSKCTQFIKDSMDKKFGSRGTASRERASALRCPTRSRTFFPCSWREKRVY